MMEPFVLISHRYRWDGSNDCYIQPSNSLSFDRNLEFMWTNCILITLNRIPNIKSFLFDSFNLYSSMIKIYCFIRINSLSGKYIYWISIPTHSPDPTDYLTSDNKFTWNYINHIYVLLYIYGIEMGNMSVRNKIIFVTRSEAEFGSNSRLNFR